MIGGQRRVVTVAFHSANDDVLPKTLASIIGQSALSRHVFR
jgi:predicted RNA binding protein YcfA (HicA-like mRNA interferase family)